MFNLVELCPEILIVAGDHRCKRVVKWYVFFCFLGKSAFFEGVFEWFFVNFYEFLVFFWGYLRFFWFFWGNLEDSPSIFTAFRRDRSARLIMTADIYPGFPGHVVFFSVVSAAVLLNRKFFLCGGKL